MNFQLNKKASWFTALLLLFATIVNAQSPGKFSANGNAVNSKALNKQVIQIMNEVGVPALSLAVISDNRVVYQKHYGIKSLSENKKTNKKTVFEAASLTKSFLAFVAHQLVDENLLELDKPVIDYMEWPEIAHDARAKNITARMILSHSSGVENWRWENDDSKLEILSDPGSSYEYSGEGYQYLSKLIEKILGKTYQEYVTERVVKPLRLKSTFLLYNDKSPANYAIGHDALGDEIEKWKNKETIPASGAHLTAGDYAKLIIATFNEKYISKEETKAVLKPLVSLNDHNVFHGMGYELLLTENDTIAIHGGINDGFRGFMAYSVTDKSGLVILTNGNRGELMMEALSDLTVKIDLETYYQDNFFSQYPSTAITLLDVYRSGGEDDLFNKLEELITNSSFEIGINSLNELATLFMGRDFPLAKKIIEKNIVLHPDSKEAHYLLGQIFMATGDFAKARKSLVKARTMNFNMFNIDGDIKVCEKQIASDL